MAAPPLDVWFVAESHVEFRPVDTGALLVDTQSGACFQLNRVGTELWRGVVSGRPLAHVIDEVRSRYHAAETIVADAVALCDKLTAAGLLRRNDGRTGDDAGP